jgi:3-hydroxyisobutyrate dehydrogenase-like beta-hydroxyacid dehydrogenase
MVKDLGLALSAADTMKMPLLGCNLTRELLKATSASGLGQKDWTILRKTLERLAGDEV